MFIIGLLIILALIAGFVLPVRTKPGVVEVPNPNFQRGYVVDPERNPATIKKAVDASHPALVFIVQKKIRIIFGILGVLLLLSHGMWFWADATKQYFLVYPWGQRGSVMSQGLKFRGFARITSWPKYIDVKTIDSEDQDISEIEGVMKPVDIRFIDQVTAQVLISARYQIPEDPQSFEAMAIKFQTLSNLVNNTLIPATREQVNNTGYMFKAQDYISGEAQSFRQTLDEQLKDGAYVVEKLTLRDTVWSSVTDGIKSIKEVKTTYEVEKVLRNGVPQRIDHEITSNNIKVSQVIVDDVILEPAFKQRLEAQRDESAKRQLEQQKIETAKDSQLRIIAEGERDKAAERVAEEKKAVTTLIAIETKLAEEETNKKLAAIQLETERLNASKVKVKADAEAYEISKKVNAGITPEVELQMRLDAQVKIEAEKAKTKWPYIYMPGSGASGGSLEALIKAGMATQLPKSQ